MFFFSLFFSFARLPLFLVRTTLQGGRHCKKKAPNQTTITTKENICRMLPNAGARATDPVRRRREVRGEEKVHHQFAKTPSLTFSLSLSLSASLSLCLSHTLALFSLSLSFSFSLLGLLRRRLSPARRRAGISLLGSAIFFKIFLLLLQTPPPPFPPSLCGILLLRASPASFFQCSLFADNTNLLPLSPTRTRPSQPIHRKGNSEQAGRV